MNRAFRRSATLLALLPILLVSSTTLADGTPAENPVLPPELPWDGASQELIAAADDPWITPGERSGLRRSPSYDDTIDWLKRLVSAAPELSMVALGESPEGRVLWMVVAAAESATTPEALHASGKPVVLAQAGIHSGEIDGKDAGMMLLRDLTVGATQRHLLDRVSLLFIPIFNVDGHERASRFGRLNQRGPEVVGWRTTARNLNLNRDHAKLDTPEMRAVVAALGDWRPDLYVDLHVTDGIDYQYDITWGYSGPQAHSPAISAWLSGTLDPPAHRALKEGGHVPGPLIFAIDSSDPGRGLFHWSAASQRYSDGYGAARHLPTILVENHSLKPYPQRVLGTYLLLASYLDTVGREVESLRRAIATDRARRPAEVPLAFTVPQDEQPGTMEFLAVGWRKEPSTISGGERIVWTGEPQTIDVPRLVPSRVTASVARPAAYWIPPAWSDVIERLELHGIELERFAEAREVDVEMYRLEEAELADSPFEGRIMATAGSPTVERRRQTYPPRSARVPTDQPLGDLAILLLEPQAPDSFFSWGFFHSILSATEYFEAYVMEPTGERMLDADPELRAEFEAAIAADSALADDPRARLHWLYQRTPFFDERWRLYPIGREMPAE